VSRLSRKLARPAPPDAQLVTLGAYPSGLAWSSRGDLLAVAGDHGGVELIDAATCTVRQRISAHDGPVQSIAWHPERDVLLTTGQDGAVRGWERPFETARELIAPSTSWADHACWSAAGDRAAVALGTRAHVLSDGGVTAVTEPVASTIAGLAFTPSGKTLGVACYGGVQLFDPATGRPTRKLEWKGSMLSIAFAPDGSTVACGCQDNSVHFWRIASGKDAQMCGYPAKPRDIAFSHDGRWLATGGDAMITLWPFDRRGPEGRTPVQLKGHEDLVTALACAPLVEMLMSGARDGTVALWTPPKLTVPFAVSRLTGRVTHVAWGKDLAAQVLRWAASDEHGRVLIGQL
jgi:WD40 repeat protein